MEQALKNQVSINQVFNKIALCTFACFLTPKKGEPKAKKGESKLFFAGYFRSRFCSILPKSGTNIKKHKMLKYRYFCSLLKEKL